MIERCYLRDKNERNYSRYGGRGIVVCARFRIFEYFVEDMGLRPEGKTIDRIKGELNYACGRCNECILCGWELNCRWATTTEQNLNRKANRILAFDEKAMTVTEWAILLNKPRLALFKRLDAGWSIEKTLTTPVRKRAPNKKKDA